MLRRIRANFFTGLLIVIPLVLTYWVFYFIISRLNLLLLEPIMDIFDNWLPRQNLEFLIKIAIFFMLLVLLTLLGFAVRIIVIKNIFAFCEKALSRVPIISAIYGGLKEISFAFFGQKESIFKKVVLVEYPRKGVYTIGFVTSEMQGEAQEKTGGRAVTVFLPTTPNPATGIFVLVPQQDVTLLDMSVADGMKMIISGGAVVPGSNYGNTENRGNTFKEKGP